MTQMSPQPTLVLAQWTVESNTESSLKAPETLQAFTVYFLIGQAHHMAQGRPTSQASRFTLPYLGGTPIHPSLV